MDFEFLILAGVVVAAFVWAVPTGAVISTGLLTKGLRSEFNQKLGAVKTFFQDLTTRIASGAKQETYAWLGTVPMMREWGTGRVAKGLRTETYTVENLKYEATIEVDRDEISDDQTGQIRMRIGELAQRAGTHKDKMIADLIANGESAGFNAYDGKRFFAADHESGSSGVQSNKLDFDISAVMPDAPDTPDAPSVKTLQQAFAEALAAMMGYKDDQGEPLDIDNSGLVVLCHPGAYTPWLKAMTTGMVDNSDNILKQFQVRVLPLARLTDQSKFYLTKTDVAVRPFIFQDREPIEFNALDAPTSDESFKREKFLYGVRARYRVTFGYWQYCVRVNLI